jgi:hypothetical protein
VVVPFVQTIDVQCDSDAENILMLGFFNVESGFK